MSGGPLKLSAIICTLNRYEDVNTCLEALNVAAERTEVEHEIVIVDQTDEPQRQPAVADGFRNVRHIFQNDKGLSSARDFGLTHSEGEIVAYLDDDAVPSPQWFDEIVRPFDAPESAHALACGGRVTADYRRGARPDWMTPALELYLSCVDWGDKGRFLKKGEWIVGANMAFRRSVLEAGNPFNTGLGRKGTKTLLSNEEVSLFESIGIENIWYSPAAEVGHVIGTERMRQIWFRKRVFWQSMSDVLADISWLSRDKAWSDFAAFIAAAPAERRSMLALFGECDDAALFDMQLKAIYGLTSLASDGFTLPDDMGVS